MLCFQSQYVEHSSLSTPPASISPLLLPYFMVGVNNIIVFLWIHFYKLLVSLNLLWSALTYFGVI